ncbi:MAG TPA: DUF2892 domain-containing protein [Chloroflexota bacterium]|nr:DUF2892 domain-containing protein [Chloroflexota bacterium]HUM71050.1 DUF2892 domain-containing protein [Chloroflexota bacterium]
MWETLANLADVKYVNLNLKQRLISLVGGAALLVYAVVRIPFTAVLAFFAAIYLVFRGLRGFCYLYDQLGWNTAVPLPHTERHAGSQTAVTSSSALPISREPNSKVYS